MNFDKLTTIIGVMTGMFHASTVDLNQLQTGSHTQQIQVLTAIGIALMGYFTNKSKVDTKAK